MPKRALGTAANRAVRALNKAEKKAETELGKLYRQVDSLKKARASSRAMANLARLGRSEKKTSTKRRKKKARKKKSTKRRSRRR